MLYNTAVLKSLMLQGLIAYVSVIFWLLVNLDLKQKCIVD
ncbi:hypothetical protein CZ797_18225 [Pseudoalteromonas sp. JB197]|nr:hypothetical protein CZ797_18225 [Pseudoalteromonas sp. JB197]